MSRAEGWGSADKVNLSKALGKLEVLDPEDNDIPKTRISMSPVSHSQSPEFTKKRPISFQNGKLQVLGPEEEVVIHPYDAAARPGSAPGRQGTAGRRSYIPTKHIPLCTVKPLAHSINIPDYTTATSMQADKAEDDKTQMASSMGRDSDEKETTGPQSLAIHNGNIKGRLEESSDEDESDDETVRAPIQLLAEFITAIMEEDYQVAQKLCKMKQQESSEDEDSEDSDEETDEETDEDTSDTDDEDENHCSANHIS
ncbi:glutamate-rich protein 2 isoform X2 [Dendropsophus ebraccatus]|uniref:glutamate-rich protein 2 isoform X2 n=1 Tax=Dendropsophus ebraccatus TaxID=150705 RepID=UPI0038322146